ncbi:hypothetical protein FK531_09205 [Rhodococcus spelaei]|uniref:Uncharacterized protein n=1 Tax=Rhodococcus spelaei TaxID=2546320 RepID=A0A541BMS9_9NOCA|nr:hypothetical protein [Rhodococcus spelaei]TQF73637.1 hypothetical protein FK531_09205 [Rhodococcus spelaei]
MIKNTGQATGGLAVATIAAIALVGTGIAHADNSFGPTSNSCPISAGAQAPVGQPAGIFVADPFALLPPPQRTDNLDLSPLMGSSAGSGKVQILPGQGVLLPTHGMGVGILKGSYWRGVTGPTTECAVAGTFIVN